MSQNYDDLDMSVLFEEAARLEPIEEGAANKDFLDRFVSFPEKEGYIIVRVMPPQKGKQLYCATRTHRLVKDDPNNPGKSKKGGRNFHCPRELVTTKQGKKLWVDTDPKCPCPACMYAREIWADVEAAGGKETPKGKVFHTEYSKVKAIERFYYNCVERIIDKEGNVIGTHETPKILSIGKQLHEKMVRFAVGDPKAGRKGIGNFSHILTGRDLKIIKKIRQPGNYPYYEESEFLPQTSPLHEDEAQRDALLEKMHDLSALRVLKPVEEISIALQKYTGAIPDDDVKFDMSMYRKKPETLTEQVSAEKNKAESKPVTKVMASPVVSEEGAMSEPDFLAGLNKDIDNIS